MLKNQYGQYLLKIIEEKKREVDADIFRTIK
jgi:glucose-1-phosphate thymidylyltransferase